MSAPIGLCKPQYLVYVWYTVLFGPWRVGKVPVALDRSVAGPHGAKISLSSAAVHMKALYYIDYKLSPVARGRRRWFSMAIIVIK